VTLQSLKPLLHSLLIPNTLSYISLAGNKNLKTPGWRLAGVYLSKAVTLQFLDLSQNSLDKKAIELVAGALGTVPPSLPASTPTGSLAMPLLDTFDTKSRPTDRPQLVSLRLDGCNLRPGALESLAHAVRNSPLQHISLRNNKISPPAAVALALMIKDYPDTIPTAGNGTSSLPSSPRLSAMPLSPPATPRGSVLLSPSTTHPPSSTQPTVPGTTYTPYIPRSKRASAIATVTSSASPTVDREERQVPRFSTSQGGGVTTRHVAPQTPSEVVSAATAAARNAGPSAALLDKVRALDNLPRLGSLKTLDLRGNDLRVRESS
jgi:protein phosphatase 1 regulatory subunit 37